MQLEFFGAAGEVTGSCHIVSINGYTVLLDCGLIQGGRKQEARNREPFPFNASSVDAVVLSHAHTSLTKLIFCEIISQLKVLI